MHILHITINPIKLERRILNQVDCALQNHHQASVIYLEDSEGLPDKSAVNYNPMGIYTRFAKGGPFKFIHFNWRVFFTALHLPVDLIHVHDLWVLPAATLISMFRKIPLVYDAHEYYAGLEIFTRRKFRKKIWLIAEKWCIHHVRALITISEPLAQLYRVDYTPDFPVRVIRNLPGYETPDPAKSVNIARNQNDKILLYHGHFRPGRGLRSLIRACALLKNVQLVLIGGGELEDELKKIALENSLEDVVVFLPYIETEQLIATASQADIGIVLFEPTSVNYAHALPNKFFEYLMAGLPVLASNIDTLESYVKEYEVGLTANSQNVSDIAGRIQQMLSEQNQLDKWRNNALKAARELNWENESQKLLALYKEFQ